MKPGQNSSARSDKDLVEAATRFIDAFSKAIVEQSDLGKLSTKSGLSFGDGGIVELTDQVTEALDAFVLRAAKLLGSAAAHEKTISKTAINEAQSSLAKSAAMDPAVKALIAAVFEQGNVTYDYLVPNKLVQLGANVKELKIGRVRAMRTSDFSLQRKAEYPDSRVQIVPGDGFSIQLPPPSTTITMHPVCWIVNVDSILDNVEEESKWLIDVAVSLLRLSHHPWGMHFPETGSKEPHPTKGAMWHRDGVIFRGPRALAGGGQVASGYQINADVVATVSDKDFIAKADGIFAPPKKSLAERVSQGLGWLTRGRQGEDRAERFLYFFTAIEALLSNDDKTAPVTQTIARHGAVLLTNDNKERFKIATLIKSLYNSRSALVHAGNRSILWSSANSAQQLAEAMFWVVLQKADLKTAHAKFCEGLAASSYGLPWPSALAAGASA
jgi:Apea-like HEPN